MVLSSPFFPPCIDTVFAAPAGGPRQDLGTGPAARAGWQFMHAVAGQTAQGQHGPGVDAVLGLDQRLQPGDGHVGPEIEQGAGPAPVDAGQPLAQVGATRSGGMALDQIQGHDNLMAWEWLHSSQDSSCTEVPFFYSLIPERAKTRSMQALAPSPGEPEKGPMMPPGAKSL